MDAPRIFVPEEAECNFFLILCNVQFDSGKGEAQTFQTMEVKSGNQLLTQRDQTVAQDVG